MAVWLTRGHASLLRVDSIEKVHGTTDANGALMMTVGLPRQWWTEFVQATVAKERTSIQRAQIRLHAHPVQPGFLQEINGVALRAEFDEPVEMSMRLKRGINVHVVTRHRGKEVRAEVRLLSLNNDAAWRTAERGKQLSPGHHILQVEDEGRYALTARSQGHGTAWLPFVVIAHGEPSERIDLELSGSGMIAGRLVDPEGQPVLGHGLRAVLTRIKGATHLSTNQKLDFERGRGCVQGAAQTDEFGAFTIEGLEPGDYRLLAWEGAHYGETALLAAQVGTGSPSQRFTLQRHALIVRVIDHEGQPVETVANEGNGSRLRVGTASAYCRLAKLRAGEWSQSPWSQKRGKWLIAQLKPDREYVLGVLSSNHALQEQRVLLTLTDYQREVVVHLPAPVEPAVLHLGGVGPGGVPVSHPLTLTVRTPEGRTLLEWESTRSSGKELPLQLPPGPYVVSAEESWERVIRSHVGVEETIELKANEVKRMTLELGAAGYLGVHPEIGGPPGRIEPGEELDLRAWRSHGLVQVHLVPNSPAEVMQLEFPHQGPAAMSHPSHDLGLPAGSRLRAVAPIAVGKFKVRLLLRGYEPFEQQVQIQEGRCTWIKATLTPRQ